MATAGTDRTKWGDSFIIDGGRHDGFIRLAQTGRKTFQLESTIEYAGETGLEGKNFDAATMATLRSLTPEDLTDTDLASVPQAIRWWANTYGIHTPAALIHDRFIGGELPDGVSEQDIDRYFRFMLKDTGVRFIKRWIMWSATALRTRFASGGAKRASVIIWALLAVAGVAAMIYSLMTGQWLVAGLLAFPTPVVFSALWGRQYGAAIFAAYATVPWLVPPMLISLVFLVLYTAAEWVATRFLDPENVGTEPILWTNDPERDGRLRSRVQGLQPGELSQEATAR